VEQNVAQIEIVVRELGLDAVKFFVDSVQDGRKSEREAARVVLKMLVAVQPLNVFDRKETTLTW
jgi:hypothetical protein